MPQRPHVDESRGPQQWGLWLAVALAVALALRLFRLGEQSLWVDEILTWRAAEPFARLVFRELLDDTHGPGVSAFLHAWMRLFGDSEFALRLPMALASVALVPLCAWLARATAGPRACLPAAWLAAGSPFLVWYGQECRNYAFAMVFAAVQLLAAMRYHERGRRRDLVLLGAAAVLGALSNLNGLLLFVTLLALLVVGPPAGRGRLAPLLVTAAGVVLVLSPWLLTYAGVLDLGRLVPGRAAAPGEAPLRGATTFSWAAVPYLFYTFSTGFSFGPGLRELRAHADLPTLLPYLPLIAAAGLAFGALALAGLRALWGRPFALAALAVSIVGPLAVVLYFALMNFKPFNVRYVSVGFPAWVVLLAAGFAALAPPWRRVAGLWVAGIWLVGLLHHYFDPQYRKDDFRAAAAALAAGVAPGDSLVAAGNYSPLDYYWRGRTPAYAYYWLGYARDDRMVPRFEAHRSAAGSTWVVVSRPWDLDPAGRFEAWLGTQPGVTRRDWPGVRVYRLPPPASGG